MSTMFFGNEFFDMGTESSSGGGGSERTIVQTATGAASVTLRSTYSGDAKLLVIALNSEASTYSIDISAELNNAALTGSTLSYNTYLQSADNVRNYRVNIYDVSVEAGDEISVNLTNYSNFTSVVCALVKGSISQIVQAVSKADAAASGDYWGNCSAVLGTFDSRSGGNIMMTNYSAGLTVATPNPGSGYKSSYIFWLE